MFLNKTRAQARQVIDRFIRSDELIRICPPVVPHRDRLTAPDQLCAGCPESPPAPKGGFGWVTIRRAVPSFHRVNRDSISNEEAPCLHRLRERRFNAHDDFTITRKGNLFL